MFPFIVLTIPFDLLCIFQHRLGKNESCSSLIQIRNVGAGAGGLYSEAPNKMSDMEVQRVTMYFETAGKKGKKKNSWKLTQKQLKDYLLCLGHLFL